MDYHNINATKHGLSTHPIAKHYYAMHYRCSKDKYYTSKGVKVCDRWHDINNFIEDMFSTWQRGLQLDRIDNDGDYSPDNCRWATRSQNMKNRSVSSDIQSEVDHVHFNKQDDKWVVLRRFNTKEEAEKFAILTRSFQ